MKELKALEILKAISENEEKIVFDDGSYYYDEYIDEAITELEALQESKTCEWKVEDSDYNTYKTGCTHYFTQIYVI